MSPLRPLRLAFALSTLALAGCGPAAPERSEGTAQAVETTRLSRIEQVAASVEERGGGHVHVVVERFADGEIPGGLGAALAGDARRAAALDCAIYGGGLSPDPDEKEDADKYLDAAARSELADRLLAAIGDAALHRIDSFGIGDPGDDFSARCTVAVRLAPGALALVQGHGRDRF